MIDTIRATGARLANGKRLLTASLAILGGVVMAAGTLLPWVTLFAGLQSYAGIAGLNGKLLFCGGLLSILAGAWFLFSGGRFLRLGIGLLGFACLAFAGWLLVELVKTRQQLSTDPLLFAGLGPGLIVTTAGALIVFSVLLIEK